MGGWAAATLTLDCQKLWNKGEWYLSWCWWPWTILSTNLLDVMLLHWSKNLKSIPTWKTADEGDEEAEDCYTSGVPTPTAPFPPSIGRTGRDTATSRLLATWISVIPTLQVRPLSQRCTTRPWQRFLLHCEKEPSSCGLGTLLEGKDWDKPMEDCCWTCTRDQLIQPYRQASLGGITSLTLQRKGNCEAQTSGCCLETELNVSAKIWAEFPTHLETALSKMPWTLRSNSHTSDTGIMPPSELGREERVSTRKTLRQEISCSVSRVAWAAAPTPVWKSERDRSAFLLAEVKVMLSGGVEDQNLKAARWLEK